MNLRESNILFLNLERKNGNLYEIANHKDFHSFISFLESKNIRGQIYTQDYLSNLIELTEDIIFTDLQHIAIRISLTNLHINKVLIKELKKENSNIKVYGFGTLRKNEVEELLQSTKIDAWIFANPEATLCNLMRKETALPPGIALLMEDEVIFSSAGIDTGSVSGSLPLQNIRGEFGHDEQLDAAMNHDQENLPLINGFIASNTGLYPPQFIGLGTKHVTINEEANLDYDAFQSLKEIVNINSALILNSTASGNDDEIRALTGINYRNALKKAEEANYFLGNFHQVMQNKSLVKINDDQKQLHVNFNVLKAHHGTAQIEHDLELAEINDQTTLERFIHAVQLFHQEGKVLDLELMDAYLVNSCSWTGINSCQAGKLPRFTIDRDLNVLPCKSCSKSAGSLFDLTLQLQRNVSVILNKEQIQRGCHSCPVKDSCSKCAFLPDFLQADEYCDLRRKYPLMEMFMVSLQVLPYLKKYSHYFQDLDLMKLAISHRYHSTIFPREISGNEPAMLNNSFQLISYQNNLLIFNIVNNKILKVSEVMAFVMEGLYKNASKADIVQCLTNKYPIEPHDADEIYEKCLQTFVSHNWIHNLSRV